MNARLFTAGLVGLLLAGCTTPPRVVPVVHSAPVSFESVATRGASAAGSLSEARQSLNAARAGVASAADSASSAAEKAAAAAESAKTIVEQGAAAQSEIAKTLAADIGTLRDSLKATQVQLREVSDLATKADARAQEAEGHLKQARDDLVAVKLKADAQTAALNKAKDSAAVAAQEKADAMIREKEAGDRLLWVRVKVGGVLGLLMAGAAAALYFRALNPGTGAAVIGAAGLGMVLLFT